MKTLRIIGIVILTVTMLTLCGCVDKFDDFKNWLISDDLSESENAMDSSSVETSTAASEIESAEKDSDFEITRILTPCNLKLKKVQCTLF